MTSLSKREKRVRPEWVASVFLVALILSGATGIHGQNKDAEQPWNAPKSARELRNPAAVTPQGQKSAAQFYKQNCVKCHGKTGDSNGAAAKSLPKKPTNFTDEDLMRKATDGELFWKIGTGRAPMPSYQDKMSETERWQLVNYLRMLAMRAQYRYLGTAD
ncbi:MAG: cytochrome c [Candidatus Acidiferrales bacterium]